MDAFYKTIVKVRTAVGETKEAETGEGLGQGTNEGPLISASSFDYTVDEHEIIRPGNSGGSWESHSK
jgi:hypothetical protein